MADDFNESVLDISEICEGLASSTASAFSATSFHRLGPFAPPTEFGFGHFCPRRIGGGFGASHSLFGEGFPSVASSTFSSIEPTARFTTSPLWPLHHPAPLAPRHPPVPDPELPRLPTLRDLSHGGPINSSRVYRGLSALYRRTTPARTEPNSDDYYLNELAANSFSSPSMLNESSREPNTTADSAQESSPWPTTTGSSNDSGGQENGNDIKDEPAGDDLEMPPRTGGGSSTARRGGRKPIAPAESSRPTRKRKHDDVKAEDGDDDPFTDAPSAIDLTETEEVPASLKEPEKPNNNLKLSKFQCVICMDDTSSLTITHCGHLFCGECLHSSLYIDASKKICPICRQKVDARPSSGRFGAKAKGYYPLQLRVLTKKSLGKRAVQ